MISNHFIDTGLLVKKELLVSRAMSDVLKHTKKSELSIIYKVIEGHVNVKETGKETRPKI